MRINLVAKILLISALLISCTVKQPHYSVEVFKVENGWGYSIVKQGNRIIKQEYMPSINSQIPFKTKKDALAIGTLVIKKLKSHKSPSITNEELKFAVETNNNN